ncbi:TPA: LysM peptidoglycan-binding domain-containing protein, partial [Enterococcus faecalis]
QQQQAQNQQPVYDTVQSGEGARQVAERNGMTLEQILALNPGIDTSVFYPGQPLRIK